MKAILVVLLLAGSAWGCVGEDCWPFDVQLTGYELGPIELETQEGCPPVSFQINWFAGQTDGQGIGGGGWWDSTFPDDGWTWQYTRAEMTGTSPEDGLAIFEFDYWAIRPDGNGGFIDPVLGYAYLRPNGNDIFFAWDNCGYRAKNVPYSLSGPQVMGDSNFDGVFDSSDLVSVFIAGKYEQDVDATWAEGNWAVTDRRFNSGDFVAALTYGDYADATVAAVPEPSSALLLLLGIVLHRNLRRSTNAAIDD